MDCIEELFLINVNEHDMQNSTILNRDQVNAALNAIHTLDVGKRRKKVLNAFDIVILNLRENTGEVMLTRDQLAQKIGCAPSIVSRIMINLVHLGIITRKQKRMRAVKGLDTIAYFVNPHVAWKGSFIAFKARIAESKPPFSPSL